MKRGQSRSWTRKNELPEDDLLSRTRCNGVITQKKKLHGKHKTICELITQSFSIKEEICTYSVKGDFHLFCKSNLQLASLNSQGSPKVNCENACREQPEEKLPCQECIHSISL